MPLSSNNSLYQFPKICRWTLRRCFPAQLLADIDAEDDPLEEDLMSPVPHLVHRYPDRVLLMVTNQCPIYCRFCTRKRLVGKPGFLKKGELDRAITYLREHQEVRDVILSGGDPLLPALLPPGEFADPDLLAEAKKRGETLSRRVQTGFDEARRARLRQWVGTLKANLPRINGQRAHFN